MRRGVIGVWVGRSILTMHPGVKIVHRRNFIEPELGRSSIICVVINGFIVVEPVDDMIREEVPEKKRRINFINITYP